MHWFIDPIQNHYFDFEGRTARKEFWMYILFYIIGYIIFVSAGQVLGFGLEFVYGFALLLPTLGITARRLHDTGMSGWWQLIGLIPVLGFIVMVVLTVREGDAGSNAYGATPDASKSQENPVATTNQTEEETKTADQTAGPTDQPS